MEKFGKLQLDHVHDDRDGDDDDLRKMSRVPF